MQLEKAGKWATVTSVVLTALIANGCGQSGASVAACPKENLGNTEIVYAGAYWGMGSINLTDSATQPGTLDIKLTLQDSNTPGAALAVLGGTAYCDDRILRAQFGSAQATAAQLNIIGGELTGVLEPESRVSFGIWRAEIARIGEENKVQSIHGHWQTPSS